MDQLAHWLEYLLDLGMAFWAPTTLVVTVWALIWIPRWLRNRANRRRHREFEEAARVRWEGHRRADPWTDRIGYRGAPRRQTKWGNPAVLRTIVVATAFLILGSVAVWMLRDAGGLSESTGSAEGTLRVNINTATLTELESIPGIGEVLAKQIVAHRPYASIDQLVAIRGIGASSIEQLRPYVKVDGESEKLR